MAKYVFDAPLSSPLWRRDATLAVNVANTVGGRSRAYVDGVDITVAYGDVIEVDDATARAILESLDDTLGTPMVTLVPDTTPARERWDDSIEAERSTRGIASDPRNSTPELPRG